MHMKRIIFAAIVLLPTSVWADSCPQIPDQSAQLDPVYDQLLETTSKEQAGPLVADLWQIWLAAPDDKAQKMLDVGIVTLRSGNYVSAANIFTALVDYCPNYVEGYNQRAFAYYLSGNFEAALPDLARALEIRPRHLGALTGKALTHFQLDQTILAEEELRKATAINPWISEAELLGRLSTEL